MKPDHLQDKERSARLSQKGNVSLCAILDLGTTLEHSRSREQWQQDCAGQKARTESDIPNLQSKWIKKGTSHSNAQNQDLVGCLRSTDNSESSPEYGFFSSQPALKTPQRHLDSADTRTLLSCQFKNSFDFQLPANSPGESPFNNHWHANAKLGILFQFSRILMEV